jgi:hypothetical protein
MTDDIDRVIAGRTEAQRASFQSAIRAASEGRECPQPIYPPLTAISERLDKTFETHCRHLTGRPKERAVAKPDAALFAARLTDEQVAYVFALPQHKLSRWGVKVRLSIRARLQERADG